MPEHPGTCYRMQVSVTPESIVNNSTIKIIINANSTGEPVCISGIWREFDIGIMKFMTPEYCGPQRGIARACALNIADYSS